MSEFDSGRQPIHPDAQHWENNANIPEPYAGIEQRAMPASMLAEAQVAAARSTQVPGTEQVSGRKDNLIDRIRQKLREI